MNKYAVLVLLKDEIAWRYITKSGYKAKRSDTDFSNNNQAVKETLFDSFGDAETAVYEEMVSESKRDIAAIKISLMNRYNLNKESEVMMYREVK